MSSDEGTRYHATVMYTEPSYAASRGIPVTEYRASFEVIAPDPETAKGKARDAFRAAVRRETVGRTREIVRVVVEADVSADG